MQRKYLLINAILASLLIVLGLQLYSQGNGSYDLPDQDLPKADSDKSMSRTSFISMSTRRQVGESDSYSVVSDHDLFRQERKPWKPPERKAEPEATPTPEPTPLPLPQNMKLEGVIKFGRKIVALISEQSIKDGKPIPYEMGDILGETGYTLAMIKSDLVKLKTPDGTVQDLKLRDYSQFAADASKRNIPQPRQHHQRQQAKRQPYKRAPRRATPIPPIPKEPPAPPPNPFPFLQQALEKAQRDMERKAMEEGYDDYYDEKDEYYEEYDRRQQIPSFLLGLGE